MSLEQILFGCGGALFILMSIIQIAPIKINPWSRIAKAIGRAMNGELIDKVNSLADEVTKLRNAVEVSDIETARTRIIRFGDEILSGVVHSKEHYDKILLDITTYENYCFEHPKFINNVAKATIKNIEESYQKHWRERSFLQR